MSFSMILTWRKISRMSPPKATGCFRNVYRTLVRGYSRSGPARMASLRLIPLLFAAVSKTSRSFPGLSGFVTQKCGKYRVGGGFDAASSPLSLWLYPFATYSFILPQYKSARLRSFLSFFSMPYSRCSALARDSVSCVIPSRERRPVSQ